MDCKIKEFIIEKENPIEKKISFLNLNTMIRWLKMIYLLCNYINLESQHEVFHHSSKILNGMIEKEKVQGDERFRLLKQI